MQIQTKPADAAAMSPEPVEEQMDQESSSQYVEH